MIKRDIARLTKKHFKFEQLRIIVNIVKSTRYRNIHIFCAFKRESYETVRSTQVVLYMSFLSPLDTTIIIKIIDYTHRTISCKIYIIDMNTIDRQDMKFYICYILTQI